MPKAKNFSVEEDQASQKYPTMAEVMGELERMANIGFPIATMALIGYLKNMVSVICMGRLGSLELAGGSLAIGFTNITGYSVLAGLAMGMEPLCSQAFGSRNFLLASHTLQKTILILLLFSVPISLLWISLEPFMLILHQDREISRIASLYSRYSMPDLIINSLLLPLRIYLRNKGTTWPLLWCTLLAIFFHFPITIFLTFSLHLGVKGIAISTFVTNFNTLSFLLVYLFLIDRAPGALSLYVPLLFQKASIIQCPVGETLDTKDFDACMMIDMISCNQLSDLMKKRLETITTLEQQQNVHRTILSGTDLQWGLLIKLAIPSCLAVCLEWWWYEFMTILAGYLCKPRISLATSAIVIQTTSLMYTLPTALSASVSTRVGNELGAGRPEKARLATIVALGLALITSLLGLVWTTFGRHVWGRVFTRDDEVLELTMAVLPIIGLCELANCPQTTSCGVLRGTARPGAGAAINFCSFYLVGAPMAIVLAFVWQLGFVGLCYGLLAAQIVCVVLILQVVFNTDWERESMKANDLVGKGDIVFAADPIQESQR